MSLPRDLRLALAPEAARHLVRATRATWNAARDDARFWARVIGAHEGVDMDVEGFCRRWKGLRKCFPVLVARDVMDVCMLDEGVFCYLSRITRDLNIHTATGVIDVPSGDTHHLADGGTVVIVLTAREMRTYDTATGQLLVTRKGFYEGHAKPMRVCGACLLVFGPASVASIDVRTGKQREIRLFEGAQFHVADERVAFYDFGTYTVSCYTAHLDLVYTKVLPQDTWLNFGRNGYLYFTLPQPLHMLTGEFKDEFTAPDAPRPYMYSEYVFPMDPDAPTPGASCIVVEGDRKIRRAPVAGRQILPPAGRTMLFCLGADLYRWDV